jgi:hypothetical protein
VCDAQLVPFDELKARNSRRNTSPNRTHPSSGSRPPGRWRETASTVGAHVLAPAVPQIRFFGVVHKASVKASDGNLLPLRARGRLCVHIVCQHDTPVNAAVMEDRRTSTRPSKRSRHPAGSTTDGARRQVQEVARRGAGPAREPANHLGRSFLSALNAAIYRNQTVRRFQQALFWATNLRSPASVSELRLASQASSRRSQAGVDRPPAFRRQFGSFQ